MKKDKNSKLDLIWVLPEIVGSFAIVIVGIHHINVTPSHVVVGLMEWMFQMGLVMVVVGIGIKGITHGFNELEKVELRSK